MIIDLTYYRAFVLFLARLVLSIIIFKAGVNKLPVSEVGGKWRPIIIMRISQNINRFGILQRGIDGISKNMLTRELRDLEKNNIISRKIYAEIPPRVEYSLTKKGKSLVPVLDKLNDWALSYIR